MFIEITAPELPNLIKEVQEFRPLVWESQRSAIGSAGFYASQEVADWIASEGKGIWKKRHPVSKVFGKRGMASLYRAVRYFQYGKRVEIGFGNVKGKDPRPNTDLEDKVERLEKGFAIQVSDKMRRKFGATRNRLTFGKEPGVDYFPLRSSTKQLTVPPRPINTPVFRRIKPNIFPLFEKKFLKSIGRKSKLADAEFRKGLSTDKD